MPKRQETTMTSSSSPSRSRRENAPCHTKTQSIGCMTGVFHFISRYHSTRRLLTTGKKQENNKQINNSSYKRKRKTNIKNKNNSVHKTSKPKTENVATSSENVISSPPVAEEVAAEVAEEVAAEVAEEVAAEVKRRNLVAALEKCDHDLKAISSIINDLRSNGQKPSVLWHLNPSYSSRLGIDTSLKVANARITRNGGMLHPKKPQPGKDFFEKVISRVLSAQARATPLQCRKSKIESVDEVCSELVWGIDREFGKIGLVLTNHIFRYLIDEFVEELIGDIMNLSLPKMYRAELALVRHPLPRHACRRRLSY